jgi:hypothetical protein
MEQTMTWDFIIAFAASLISYWLGYKVGFADAIKILDDMPKSRCRDAVREATVARDGIKPPGTIPPPSKLPHAGKVKQPIQPTTANSTITNSQIEKPISKLTKPLYHNSI